MSPIARWRTCRAARQTDRIVDLLGPVWRLQNVIMDREDELVLPMTERAYEGVVLAGWAVLDRHMVDHPELCGHPAWGDYYDAAIERLRRDPEWAGVLGVTR